jgi:hypothetical protein
MGEMEVGSNRLKHLHGFVNDFWADAIPAEDRDHLGHGRIMQDIARWWMAGLRAGSFSCGRATNRRNQILYR